MVIQFIFGGGRPPHCCREDAHRDGSHVPPLSTSTIVIAPTIELVQQWRDRLQKTFGIEVGQIGGGEKDIRDVSVSTYDSAYLMAEKLGNRFRFLLVDEVHHLAAERYVEIARMYASPYRMGLTATYERTDMLHERLEQFMGGKVFELGYEELRRLRKHPEWVSGATIFLPAEAMKKEKRTQPQRFVKLSYAGREVIKRLFDLNPELPRNVVVDNYIKRNFVDLEGFD